MNYLYLNQSFLNGNYTDHVLIYVLWSLWMQFKTVSKESMTNCTRSTMNWHNYPKDFLWIESNSELRARLIGSIIIGDRGSACWAISVINSALDSVQSEGIHHWTCHVLFNFYFITVPSRIPPFVCPYASGHFHLSRKKTLGKKRQLRRSLATAACGIERWGRAWGKRWGREWVLLVLKILSARKYRLK